MSPVLFNPCTGNFDFVGSSGGGGGGGSTWYTGSGAPSGSLGADGDFYLNSANGDYYEKVSGTWTLQGNLKGSSGVAAATAPLAYDSGTQTVSISQATTSTNGYLSSTDWNTFNNKFPYPAGSASQYIRGDGTLATFPTLISEAQSLVTEVYNKSGATIPKGSVVYISGDHGNLPTIALAKADTETTSSKTYGLTKADISDNSSGWVVHNGLIGDLNTNGLTTGVALYLSPTTAGEYTTTKPSAPDHMVFIGICTRAHPTQGTIELFIQNGFELHELHNVAISSATTGQTIRYNSTTKLWSNQDIVLNTLAGSETDQAPSVSAVNSALSGKEPTLTKGNLTESTSSVLTITNGTNAVIGSGTSVQVKQASNTQSGYLSSTDWSTFNAKEPAQIKGSISESTSSVLTISNGSNSTVGPNVTIEVKQASGTQSGYLSSTNWSTFNSKEPALSKTNLTESTSSVLTITNGTNAVIGSSPVTLQVKKATSTQSGYLDKTDWSTFNSKADLPISGTDIVTESIGSDKYAIGSIAFYHLADSIGLYFGNGIDGDLTISSGTTTLTSDMEYAYVTLTGTAKVNTAGWRMFVNYVLDISAAAAGGIYCNGNSATSATGATQYSATYSSGGTNVSGSSGGSGTTTNGGGGGTTTGSTVTLSDAGGKGGKGGNGAGTYIGGNGGTLGTTTVATKPFGPHPMPHLMKFTSQTGTTLMTAGVGGSGGGGGAGTGAVAGGTGGGGGAGGGIVYLFARTIYITDGMNLVIEAIGGNGRFGATSGTTGGGGGGGGGGGAGGFVYLGVNKVEDISASGFVIPFINVSGGNGGDGGGCGNTTTAYYGGTGGDGGKAGFCRVISNLLGNANIYDDNAATTGTAGVTGTNGNGGGTGGLGAFRTYYVST